VGPLSARRLADLIRASLVIGPVILVLTGDPSSAWGMALVAVVALVLRFARAPAWSDLLFVALLAADSWLTALGAFETFNHNDFAGHLVLPLAVTPILFHLAQRTGVLVPPSDGRKVGVIACGVFSAGLTVALGTGWELVEWASDTWAHTNMSLGYSDTLGDLASDVAGATLGGVLVSLSLIRISARRCTARRTSGDFLADAG
jgi:hypothetical protein